MQKQCKHCLVFFDAKRKDNIFCSKKCKNSFLGKKWYALNNEKVKEISKKYRQKNKQTISEQNKEWRQLNCEKIKNDKKEWQEKFKNEHGISYATYRRQNDLKEKIKHNIRVRTNKAIKGINKSGSAVDELGCSIEDFKTYLESQFEPWMNWDNYGSYSKDKETWNIDHFLPLNSFDLSNPEEFKKACNYKNLKPKKALDNLKKGSKNPIDV